MSLLHLKRCAVHNSRDQRRESVAVLPGVLNDLARGGHIVILETAPERVGQHLFCNDASENVLLIHERLTQADGAVQWSAVEQRSRGVDFPTFIIRSPAAGGIE